ncbi:hypothetical protein DFH09DRAFT_223912 [Mycena vulgaris]|nr:hypothetical protein DFH09DRAFT_223912 [Mycena vulgaris]
MTRTTARDGAGCATGAKSLPRDSEARHAARDRWWRGAGVGTDTASRRLGDGAVLDAMARSTMRGRRIARRAGEECVERTRSHRLPSCKAQLYDGATRQGIRGSSGGGAPPASARRRVRYALTSSFCRLRPRPLLRRGRYMAGVLDPGRGIEETRERGADNGCGFGYDAKGCSHRRYILLFELEDTPSLHPTTPPISLLQTLSPPTREDAQAPWMRRPPTHCAVLRPARAVGSRGRNRGGGQ